MENKRKKTSVDPSVPAKENKLSSEITFDQFFVKCVHEGKLKHWQHNEIAAFFKDLRLKEKEDLKTYEAALVKY